jgi:hypothetical protein
MECIVLSAYNYITPQLSEENSEVTNRELYFSTEN